MRDRDPPDREDREWLRRLAEGDRDALEPLYRRHAPGAFRHALWVLGRREDAEDVVHDVFVRLAGLGAELLGIRRLSGYLGTMVHREAVTKRRSRRGDASLDPASLDLPGSANPEEESEHRGLVRRVAALPPDQREAVALRLWGGFSFREIGRITGVSTFTAASRYRLALGRLRREMERAGDIR